MVLLWEPDYFVVFGARMGGRWAIGWRQEEEQEEEHDLARELIHSSKIIEHERCS